METCNKRELRIQTLTSCNQMIRDNSLRLLFLEIMLKFLDYLEAQNDDQISSIRQGCLSNLRALAVKVW